jgi:hypothetical protein
MRVIRTAWASKVESKVANVRSLADIRNMRQTFVIA